jgi:hypothetical protein
MKIKAKYKTPFGIFWKYFHDLDEMNEFFEKNKICKFISYEEGPEVTRQAEKYGYK